MNPVEIRQQIEKFSTVSYSRSGGPGGQNVNKVNTKVLLTLPVEKLSCLSSSEQSLLRQKLSSRINSRDELYIQVQDTRSQLYNRELAVDQLTSLIRQSLIRQRKRKNTRPTRSSVEKRLSRKKKRGEQKKTRSSRNWHD